MSRDRSILSFKHEKDVHVAVEDGFFQLDMKSKVLSVSSPSGFVKSSLEFPFAVPQRPLNGPAIIPGTYKMRIKIGKFIKASQYTSILMLFCLPIDKIMLWFNQERLITFPVRAMLKILLFIMIRSTCRRVKA